MHLIPGLVMILAASGALYKTVEIWSNTEYDAEHDGKKAKAKPATGPVGSYAQTGVYYQDTR